MARPIKQGLDYFPFDVGFFSDIKVKKISRACGPGAPSILICLLANIYRDYGYYAGWDEDMCFLISDEVGVSERAVCEVVIKAAQVGFFDNDLYLSFNILTSRGIQKRYFKAIQERKEVEIISDYWIGAPPLNNPEKKKQPEITVIRLENGVNPGNNGVNPPRSTQRKEKERKEKKSTEERMGENAQPRPANPKFGTKRFDKPTVEQIKAYCVERKNNIDPEYFFDYQEARGWVLSNGKQMQDWKATIRTWEKKDKERNSKAGEGNGAYRGTAAKRVHRGGASGMDRRNDEESGLDQFFGPDRWL